jgi:hypothetical protein
MAAGVSERDARIVIARSGGVCEVCGRAAMQNIHHRRGRGMGGTRRAIHSPAWLLAVCGMGNTSGCHRRIESDRPTAEANGWALPWAVEDAGTVPAVLWFGRVLLDDAGGYTLAG